MIVYVEDKKISVSPKDSIGSGGEADIFRISDTTALKIFKGPDHPDFFKMPDAQQAATARIQEHQTKLRDFPIHLPGAIITPQNLARDTRKTVCGYTMRFVTGAKELVYFADKSARKGIPHENVVSLFKDLHSAVQGVHAQKVVIGDFTYLNILVKNSDIFIIDADSFQFGKYLCKVFTPKFVDPLLCDPHGSSPILIRPHNELSDWYAFAVMLMECLLFVNPYGGIYAPKEKHNAIPHDARPLHRISVFHPEVRFPKPAIHYRTLPDDLAHYFARVFQKDARDVFPFTILETLRWSVCTVCGNEHTRALCPFCKPVPEAAIKEKTIVRGKVSATEIFRTPGVILCYAYERNSLEWLYHENGAFKRENKNTLFTGHIVPFTRYRLLGKKTLFAKENILVTRDEKGDITETLSIDTHRNLPVYDAYRNTRYWLSGGRLYRDGALGKEDVGGVLEGQTLFWVGPAFGFGFYRAGRYTKAFVFDAIHRGINDSVPLAPVKGQLIDSTCAFTEKYCWFFITTQEHGNYINRCCVTTREGKIEASAEAKEKDGSWLGTIRGKCAIGKWLFAATDKGIVRLTIDGANIREDSAFPDTEEFVDQESSLAPAPNGLYVIGNKTIILLTIH